jgi:hypothetical protein
MILSFSIEFNSLDQFLDHWSTKYRDPKFPDRAIDDPYIGRCPFTSSALLHLFEWKNGSALSSRKRHSIEQHYPLSYPRNQLARRYLDPKAEGGAIWNIFYMHCVNPHRWPIFDQHTFRAMHFMQTGDIKELPSHKPSIYEFYQREYIPFVRHLNSDRRKIDKALFAFGQFLKIAGTYR